MKMNLCPEAPWRSVGEWVLLLLILAARVECQMVHFNCSRSWNFKRYLISVFTMWIIARRKAQTVVKICYKLAKTKQNKFLPHFWEISKQFLHTILLETWFHSFFISVIKTWEEKERLSESSFRHTWCQKETWPVGSGCVIWALCSCLAHCSQCTTDVLHCGLYSDSQVDSWVELSVHVGMLSFMLLS